MKRSLLFIAIIALAAFALSGCQFVLGIILDPDLEVTNVELTGPVEAPTGMVISVGNWGGMAEDIELGVYITSTDQVSTNDVLVYRNDSRRFDLEWNEEDQITLNFEVDFRPFIEQNSIELPPGPYRLGVILDPDDRLDDKDPYNNKGVSQELPGLFGGGSGIDWDAEYVWLPALDSPIFETIASWGTHLFKFSTPAAGTYFISVTGITAGGDLGWYLLDYADLDYWYSEGFSMGDWLAIADSSDVNGDEINSVYLPAGMMCYLVIDEWADPGFDVSYTLTVNTP